jgi:hypothetical protein
MYPRKFTIRLAALRVKLANLNKRRIQKYIHGQKAFGTISAERQNYSSSQNKQRHGQLYRDLRKLGYQPIPTYGEWSEDADDQAKRLFQLSQKYDQEAVVYKSPSGSAGMFYTHDDPAKRAYVPIDPEDYNLSVTRPPKKKTPPTPAAFDLEHSHRPSPEQRLQLVRERNKIPPAQINRAKLKTLNHRLNTLKHRLRDPTITEKDKQRLEDLVTKTLPTRARILSEAVHQSKSKSRTQDEPVVKNQGISFQLNIDWDQPKQPWDGVSIPGESSTTSPPTSKSFPKFLSERYDHGNLPVNTPRELRTLKEFLRVKYDDGTKLVLNENPETKDLHKKVQMIHLFKTYPPFRKKILSEFKNHRQKSETIPMKHLLNSYPPFRKKILREYRQYLRDES